MLMAFKLVEDHFDELERRLKMLSKAKLEVGMFSQEQHYDSGFTDVALFAYLSRGDRSRKLPARPVTEIAFMWNHLNKSPLKKELKVYFSNIKSKKTQKDVDKILHSVGAFYRDKIADLFGKSPPLAENSSWTQELKKEKGLTPNSPLVMTGRLRSKISYKIGDSVWEYGNK